MSFLWIDLHSDRFTVEKLMLAAGLIEAATVR